MSCENCLNNTLLIQELTTKVDSLISALSNLTGTRIQTSSISLQPKTTKVNKKAALATALTAHAQYLQEYPLIYHYYTQTLKKKNLWQV